MRVEVTACTPEPLRAIGAAAGTSTGRTDPSERRAASCFAKGHMSVFEHAWATFRVEGVSRACSHQLVRHRMASFVQLSQRYTTVDTGGDWYVVPPEGFGSGRSVGDADAGEFFERSMADCARNYNDALAAGVRPEDARYLLPEAAKTDLTATMNARELLAFLDAREAPDAQWEIRSLAGAMEAALAAEPGWAALLSLRGGGR